MERIIILDREFYSNIETKNILDGYSKETKDRFDSERNEIIKDFIFNTMDEFKSLRANVRLFYTIISTDDKKDNWNINTWVEIESENTIETTCKNFNFEFIKEI